MKTRVAAMPVSPGLAVILVGDDPESHLYDALKKKACEEAGIRFELFLYSGDEPEQSLIAKIDELNGRHDVTGILVQLPLPTQNADRVIAAIRPDKDVDGFHQENLKALKEGRPGIVSALALGIMKLVDEARRVSPPHREEGSAFAKASVDKSGVVVEHPPYRPPRPLSSQVLSRNRRARARGIPRPARYRRAHRVARGRRWCTMERERDRAPFRDGGERADD